MDAVCQKNFCIITLSSTGIAPISTIKLHMGQQINALLVFCGQL